MKKILLLFLTALIAFGLFNCRDNSSRNTIPYALKKNPKLGDSIPILDSLVHYYKARDNALAHYYARYAMSVALRISTPEALVKAHVLMGIVCKNDKNDSAFYFYNTAWYLADKYNVISMKSSVIYNIAALYIEARNNQMAIQLLDSAIRLASKTNEFKVMSDAYNALGNIYTEINVHSKARHLFDTAFQIASQHLLYKQKAIALASLAQLENDPVRSIQMQKEAILFLKRSFGTEEEIASILNNIGLLCLNPDTAMYYYKSAIVLATMGGFKEVEIGGYNNLAYCYLDKKDWLNAGKCLLDHAIPLAQGEKNYDWLATLYDSYADVAYSSGKPDLAYKYQKKAGETKDTADKIQAADQVRLLSSLIDAKNSEIRIKNNEKDLDKKRIWIQWLIFSILCLLLVFMGVLLIIFRKMHKNKIRGQKQQLDSAIRLILLEEKSKGKLARELHDMISPIFTFLSTIKDPDRNSGQLTGEQAETRLTNLAEKIRHLSHRIDKVYIEQDSFEVLVRGICDDLQPLTNVRINCTLNVKEIEISVEPATHLLRIIQELLLNAVKYIKTGSIEISVTNEFGNIYIRYRDTGPGFDKETGFRNGLGLKAIVERVKIIGGEAELDTGPGRGTLWKISVPVNKITYENQNPRK